MTDKPADISQEAWDAAEQPVWLAVHSSLPMQVEVARAIQTALSTSYRQGLEDAAKVVDEVLKAGDETAAAFGYDSRHHQRRVELLKALADDIRAIKDNPK